jgi:hypothetical protein
MSSFSDTSAAPSGEPVWYRLDSMLMPSPGRDSSSINDTLSLLNPSAQPQHLFYHAQIHPKTGEIARERKIQEIDWLYGSFSLILIMIVILRLLYASDVNRLLRSMIFPGKPGSDNRIFEFRMNLFTLFFVLIYCIGMGLLLIPALELFSGSSVSDLGQTTNLFFGATALMLLMLLVKIMMIRLAGAVFSTKVAALLYQDHLLLSISSTAALIIPLIVINTFSSSFVFLSVALVILAVNSLVRVYRSFLVSFQTTGYTLFHFLLYFCTLEILPLVILGKGVILWMSGII